VTALGDEGAVGINGAVAHHVSAPHGFDLGIHQSPDFGVAFCSIASGDRNDIVNHGEVGVWNWQALWHGTKSRGSFRSASDTKKRWLDTLQHHFVRCLLHPPRHEGGHRLYIVGLNRVQISVVQHQVKLEVIIQIRHGLGSHESLKSDGSFGPWAVLVQWSSIWMACAQSASDGLIPNCIANSSRHA